MAPSPSPPDAPPPERSEWRTAFLTFAPAVALAFVVEWALRTQLAWAPRRALLTAIGIGIALALVLQRRFERRER